MTAYGRSQVVTNFGHFFVEVQCVNRKHLEISLSLPAELSRFDPMLRKLVSQRTHRGQVSVKIAFLLPEEGYVTVKPNLSLAKQIQSAWSSIAQELALEEQSLSLQMLAHYPDLLHFENHLQEEEQMGKVLHQTVSSVLDTVDAMKISEGRSLQREIGKYLHQMKEHLAHIEQVSAEAPARYRDRLLRRLTELLGDKLDDDDRILKEMCLFAERIDIAEELARMHFHIEQCEALICSQGDALGNTIEFLTQELKREANTISSKVIDHEAARIIIEVKGDIEKIRQQVQNVE